MLDYQTQTSEVLLLDQAAYSANAVSGVLWIVDVRGAATMGAQLVPITPTDTTAVIEIRGAIVGGNFTALATAPSKGPGAGFWTFTNSAAATSQNYLDVTGLAYVAFVLTTAGASGERGKIGVVLKGPGGVTLSGANAAKL